MNLFFFGVYSVFLAKYFIYWIPKIESIEKSLATDNFHHTRILIGIYHLLRFITLPKSVNHAVISQIMKLKQT